MAAIFDFSATENSKKIRFQLFMKQKQTWIAERRYVLIIEEVIQFLT